jgi:hypothetical protein
VSRASRVHKVTGGQGFGFYGQSYPLFVGEPKSLSFELLLENTVLLDEIVDDCLLWRLSQPARVITRRWMGCMTFVIAEHIIRNIV